MKNIGIDVRDTEQLVGTLSGGERQTLAIARAEYFGARVLILDEPTSALGVKESAIVLRHAISARNKGLGVIFITHNVQHALPIGDSFTILTRGRSGGTYKRGELDAERAPPADGRRLRARGAPGRPRDAGSPRARGEDVPTVPIGADAVEGDETPGDDRARLTAAARPRDVDQGGPTTPTWVTSLGRTARRIRSRARRTSTAARSGTPSSPGPSTTSEPAAAAKRRSSRWRERRRPTMAGRRTDAWRAARNVSPAPVGSLSPSVAVGR